MESLDQQMDFPSAQIMGALAGGLIGGFSGFIANTFQGRLQTRRTRKNVASALIGEIDALQRRIQGAYLTQLRREIETMRVDKRFPRSHFSGDRDYASIYKSMGPHIGLLSGALPRDLVAWYIGLAVCQERAHELRELITAGSRDLLDYAVDVAELQFNGFSELVELAGPLIYRLGRC
jgi:hypothetical protein